jgi:hypothetical protein
MKVTAIPVLLHSSCRTYIPKTRHARPGALSVACAPAGTGGCTPGERLAVPAAAAAAAGSSPVPVLRRRSQQMSFAHSWWEPSLCESALQFWRPSECQSRSSQALCTVPNPLRFVKLLVSFTDRNQLLVYDPPSQGGNAIGWTESDNSCLFARQIRTTPAGIPAGFVGSYVALDSGRRPRPRVLVPDATKGRYPFAGTAPRRVLHRGNRLARSGLRGGILGPTARSVPR